DPFRLRLELLADNQRAKALRFGVATRKPLTFGGDGCWGWRGQVVRSSLQIKQCLQDNPFNALLELLFADEEWLRMDEAILPESLFYPWN
ncbi:MAG TPA: hypothetical protein V6D27_10030, partial [Vampirovibrionales bacterium]